MNLELEENLELAEERLDSNTGVFEIKFFYWTFGIQNGGSNMALESSKKA